MSTAPNERTQERAVAERQASVALSRMLDRVKLAEGDKIGIHLTVVSSSGRVVAIDRAGTVVPEFMRK